MITISADDSHTIHKETLGYYETLKQCENERDKAIERDRMPEFICVGAPKI